MNPDQNEKVRLLLTIRERKTNVWNSGDAVGTLVYSLLNYEYRGQCSNHSPTRE